MGYRELEPGMARVVFSTIGREWVMDNLTQPPSINQGEKRITFATDLDAIAFVLRFKGAIDGY